MIYTKVANIAAWFFDLKETYTEEEALYVRGLGQLLIWWADRKVKD